MNFPISWPLCSLTSSPQWLCPLSQLSHSSSWSFSRPYSYKYLQLLHKSTIPFFQLTPSDLISTLLWLQHNLWSIGSAMFLLSLMVPSFLLKFHGPSFLFSLAYTFDSIEPLTVAPILKKIQPWLSPNLFLLACTYTDECGWRKTTMLTVLTSNSWSQTSRASFILPGNHTILSQPIYSLTLQFNIFSSLLRSSILLPQLQSQMMTLLPISWEKKESDKMFHKFSWSYQTTYLHQGPMCSAFSLLLWMNSPPICIHILSPLTYSISLQRFSSFSYINNIFFSTRLFPLSYKLNILSELPL